MTREEIVQKINGFNLSDLVSEKNYQWLKQEMINADLAVVDCYIIAKALKEKVESFAELKTPGQRQVYDIYLEIIAFFRWRCFMNLSNEEAGQFMKSQIVKANQVVVREGLPYDFMDNLSTALDQIFDWERTKRPVLLNNLNNNEELLSSRKLNFSGKKEEEPYLRNWLKDYDINSPVKEQRTALDRLNYLNNSQLVKTLPPLEKKVLTIILEVYDTLKFFVPKLEPRKTADFWAREAAKISGGAAAQRELFELYRQIKETILTPDYQSTLNNLSKNKIDNLVSNLESFVLDRNINGTLASLEILAENKYLNQALQVSKKLIQEFKDYLESKYSHEAVKSIKVERFEGVTLSLFLQFILIEKLKISTGQAVVFVMHLANVISDDQKNQFLSLVYGEAKTKMFKWRDVVEENGQLRFK